MNKGIHFTCKFASLKQKGLDKTLSYQFANRIFIICVILLLNALAFKTSTAQVVLSPEEETGSVFFVEGNPLIELNNFFTEDETETEKFSLLPTICFKSISVLNIYDTNTNVSKSINFYFRQVFLPGKETDLPPPPLTV